jgi:glycosyltransferase involved in cell wall biosynthesis
MNPVFYGFQFAHHGRFSAFSALSQSFTRQGVAVLRVPLLKIPEYVPGRIRGMFTGGWFRAHEYRLKSSFNRGDLVHYFFPENSLFQAPKWKVNGPLVLSCHQPMEQLLELQNAGAIPAFFNGLKAADAVVLMASCEIDFDRELAPSARVLCIPHGVDTGFFSPVESPMEEDGRFRVLTVGNWLRDFDLWRRVVDRISAECPNSEFTVLANPDRLTAAIANLKTDRRRVRLLKGISDEQLRNEYRRADLIFLPLLNSWANNALLEGMSCGRPVVVTDLPATREYGGDSVCYVQKGCVDDSIQQLRALCGACDKRAELGAAARKRIVTSFSWDNIAKRYMQLYRSF